MTFYNIIFGILFLGAFHEVLHSLSIHNWDTFCRASTLSILVFSDTIFTSIVIEGTDRKYTMQMKLLDLFSFILLSFAVIMLDPHVSNLYQVDFCKFLDDLLSKNQSIHEAVFWLLLAGYMALLIFWNRIGGVYALIRKNGRPRKTPDGKPMSLGGIWIWIQPMYYVAFLGMASLALADRPFVSMRLARWTTFAITTIYLLQYKRSLIRKLHPELY